MGTKFPLSVIGRVAVPADDLHMRRMNAEAREGGVPEAGCRRLVRRACKRLSWAQQDGIALVLTLIVMGVLTIGTTAVLTEVNSNEHHFGRDRQVNRALNVAEAGLNAGIAAVKALPATATSAPGVSGTTDQGSWSYTVTRTQDSSNSDLYYWTVTSTGVSPDGTVTRIVSKKVAETITHHSTSQTVHHDASDAYKYGFFLGDPSSDCVTVGTGNNFSGNLTISVSMYVAGSLCWGGSNVSMREPSGPGQTITLYVGKKFKVTGSNSSPIGTGSPSPAPCGTGCIKSATVVGGCIDTRGNTPACSLHGDPTKRSNQSGYGSGIYAKDHPSTQQNVPPPTIDTAWYTNAKPGPATGCNDDPTHPGDPAYASTYPSGYTASTFKSALFDNNSTMNTSLGTVSFLNFASFDCRYYDSSGNLKGRLMWQTGTPGTLTILGTMWIDGNLSFAGTTSATVQGRGTIYATGTISFSGQANVCEKPTSGSPCLGNYDATQNLLVLVAYNNGSHTTTGFSLTGQNTYEGIAFTNGILSEGGNATLHGPVLADTANMAGNGDARTVIDPPDGSPGAAYDEVITQSGDDTAAWADVSGSWQQLR
jgi:Tfp pilus assembly protein PilX